MPTPSQATRCLAGGGEFDFAEGYPSEFVMQLLRLLTECPVELPPSDAVLGPWVAARKADDVVVGAVSCAQVADGPEPTPGSTGGSAGDSDGSTGPQDGSVVTVGYDVAPSCEGQGYATEMLRLVCAHLLELPQILRVCADTKVSHTASRRVMEKAGLSWRRDEVDLHDGQATTVAHYARDRAPRG